MVVNGPFVEEAPSELSDRIFEEFNTLSVVYGEPAERFVTNERAKSHVANACADGPSPVPAAHSFGAGASEVAAEEDTRTM